jgi:hypothetical protein
VKYSIAVDFDGVIHQYVSPWVDANTIPDPPVPGALVWLRQVLERYEVVIYSSRLPTGLVAMQEWFIQHGGVDLIHRLQFWSGAGKPTALVYLDDRAVRFAGVFPSMEQLAERPWKYSPEAEQPAALPDHECG